MHAGSYALITILSIENVILNRLQICLNLTTNSINYKYGYLKNSISPGASNI